jgi:endoglycosylceramidase
MFYRGFEPEPGSFDDAYVDSFVRTQQLLAREGIFTVLDFHQDQLAPEYNGRGFPAWFLQDDDLPNTRASFPGGYFGNPALNRAYDHLWANDPAADGTGLIDHFAAGWRRVASRFAGQPLIAGYDIFNEPWPGSAYPACANPEGCPPGGFDQTRLTDFSNRVIGAIRGADPDRLVYYEPNLMFDVGAKTGHGQVDDPNVGMSFHNYCLGAAPGLPAVPDPLGLCEGVGETRVFENAEEHSQATGATLLMTEYGDSENSDIHARVARLADRFMVGWTVWAYMGSTGQIKRHNSKPPVRGNIRSKTLTAVVRPYPRIVAGTPRRWGFDSDAKRFEAAWTTTLPDGSRARRMASEIFVPERRYRSGYRVKLSGAELIPGDDPQLLRIRACAGADRVAVVVAKPRRRPPSSHSVQLRHQRTALRTVSGSTRSRRAMAGAERPSSCS